MAQKRLSPATKRMAMAGITVSALLLLYNVRSVLPPFILAVALAYILNPLVELLVRRTRLSRRSVVVALYIALIIGLILSIVMITPTLVRQVRAVNIDLDAIATQMRQLLADYQQVEVAGFSLDLMALSGEIKGAIQSIVSFLAARSGGVVVGVLSGLVWVVLILFVSFYLLKDAPQVQRFLYDVVPPAYQADVQYLANEVNIVLNNYLRGQLVLALVVGTVTACTLAIVGVRNALLLGVLAGLLEVIPNIGPVLASIPAIAIALFQGSANLDIEKHWFALLVAGLYVVIQQVENNVLAPRIVGRSVHLHPVVVIFGALAGASLAGVLGMLLAIPVIAIGRVLTAYMRQKMEV